jgi:hypothetical protein
MVVPRAGGGPAVPNQSIVTAKIEAIEPHPTNASLARVRVLILTSKPFNGLPDLVAGSIGKSVVLIASQQAVAGLGAGDIIAASVVFLGDEQGGQYQATNIQIQDPP